MHEIDQSNSKRSEPNQQHGNPFSAAYSLYKSLLVSMQSIILGVMFCWLGVVLIAVFHPNLTDRWKFGADMTLNVLILLVVAVQAYIYARQWEVMQEQKRMATIGERAYLGIKNVKLENLTDNTFAIHALIFNGGRTPAVNTRRRFQVGLVNKTEKRPFKWREHSEAETSLTILPGGSERWITFPHVTFTATQLSEFEAGERTIHAAGEIRFNDFMGTPQIFAFDMACEVSDGGSFKETYQRQYDDHT